MILIDVDGTLVDSVPDLAYCADEMMRQLGRQARGEAQVRNWVGNGVERLVRRVLIGRLEGEPSDADFARAYPIFLALYAENTAERSRLYPGVSEGLDYLASRGYRLGCVTNKAAQFTVPLLKALGVHDKFGIIVSGDTLLAAVSRRPHATADDVAAARAAGFQVICVSYGYNHGEDIRRYAPDAVIDSMAELASLL